MEDVLLFFGLLMLAFSMILFVRNRIVYDARMRRMKYVFSSAPEWKTRIKQFDSLSYERMLFDLRKWTYKQFYGDDE